MKITIDDFKKKINWFCNLTYKTEEGERKAIGKLIEVRADGIIILKSKNNGAERFLNLNNIEITESYFDIYEENK